MSPAVDFDCTCHGSIYLLTPLTELAREWASDHLPLETARFAGSYVIEARFLDSIVRGAGNDGLLVST